MTIDQTGIEQRYMFDQAWLAEQRRLAALETIWDPFTFSNLERLGVAPGMRCLEVGGGNGSVAAWLCRQVGHRGRVVATDLDTRFLRVRDEPNLEVREHDVTRDTLEEASYDLVHARLLLSHLPAHEEALRTLFAALKPGGWMLVEEFDHVSFLPDPSCDAADQAVWRAWMAAFEVLSAKRGLDLPYGRRLPALLEAQGLVDVHAEGHTTLERGGVPGRDLLLLSVQSLRAGLVATGEIDEGGVNLLVDLLSDPGFMWQSQIMVGARGRRPVSP
jgi:2-polyprenyl-3-methyl-5-hydroxy-6-metoxy-1,4-benzoquinol methylase